MYIAITAINTDFCLFFLFWSTSNWLFGDESKTRTPISFLCL